MTMRLKSTTWPRWIGVTAIDVTSPTLPAMAEAPDSYETIERVMKTEPGKVLDKLPDCTESRRAKDHIKLALDYAYQAREKVKPRE